MTEFTKEFIESQLEKWHSSTNDEWLTECWNNYGLALEEIQRLQARVQELEQERRWIPVSEADLQTWKKYIVVCKSSEGKPYTGLAQYFASKTVLEEDFINDEFFENESITEYDEENDCYWVKEGWFEYSIEGEIAYRLSDPVILVMPLPKPPESEC